MTVQGELTRQHIRLDRALGLRTFEEPAKPQRSQGELAFVLKLAFVPLVIIVCIVIAATGLMVQ